MRYRLRTLLWVAALLPPLVAGVIALIQLERYRQSGVDNDGSTRYMEKYLRSQPAWEGKSEPYPY